MTVDASEPVAREDHPDGTDPVEALGDRARAVPAGAFDASAPDARHCGIYSWWADEEVRHLIGRTLGTEVAPLIYIGQTTQTLARRIRAHLRVKIGKSTFRKSLTATLMTDQALAAQHPDPDADAWLDELSNWMRKHLKVAIIPVERAELGEAERAALSRYDPPLNLRNVPDPNTPARTKLKELRHRL